MSVVAQRARKLALRLAGNERGVSIVEFGLCAPIVAMMMMGITDISMGYSHKLTLEQSVYRALEKVTVGSVKTDYASLRAEVAAAADVPPDAVTIEQRLECDRQRQASFTGTCSKTQEISRYIEVSVDSDYQTSFDYGPLAKAFGGEDGEVPIHVSTSLRLQ